jgi:hypothetical protein
MQDLLVSVPDSGVVHGEHGGGQLLLGQALVCLHQLVVAAGPPLPLPAGLAVALALHLHSYQVNLVRLHMHTGCEHVG